MKKYLLTSVVATAVSVVAFAAPPVTMVEGGTAKVTAEWNFLTNMTYVNGHQNGYGVALDLGLSDRLAAQYDFSKHHIPGAGLKIHEVSAIYGLNDTFNVYGALTHIRHKTYATGFQVGVIGYRPLADKVVGYAKIGLGDDVKQSFQAGATYEYNDNIDFNLYYQYDKYDYDKQDGSIKGFHAGVGYKF